MSKKKQPTRVQQSQPDEGNDLKTMHVVKFVVSSEDHHRIKVAAAISGLSIREFCSQLVVNGSTEMTGEIMAIGRPKASTKSVRKPAT